MKRVEELCIKYLMNETDPSETADIRAEMIDDPDALIEFESMRATWSKLQGLPEFEPPAHITDAILNHASEAGRFKGVYTMSTGIKWAAAAAVVVMSGFGIWTSTMVVSNVTGESASAAVTPVSNEKQWVDRNDVLIIQPGQNPTTQSTNMSKLKPVTPTPENAAGNTDIQLAGSRKPAN
jgi:aspartate/methionine/tyrosine aminotransferase